MTTELVVTTEQTATEAPTANMLSPQRISSPNPFFDGMETERWVEGTSWHSGDSETAMFLRTAKIREENDGSVYAITLEFPAEYAPDGHVKMHIGDFLVQEDKIICYPARDFLPDKTVVCRADPWFDFTKDGTMQTRQSITRKGDIAEYSYLESYTLEDDPEGLQYGWRFGLTLYFRWEKGKGLTGYYTCVKEAAAITEFGGIEWWPTPQAN